MVDEDRFQYVNENNEIEWLTAEELAEKEKQKNVGN